MDKKYVFFKARVPLRLEKCLYSERQKGPEMGFSHFLFPALLGT